MINIKRIASLPKGKLNLIPSRKWRVVGAAIIGLLLGFSTFVGIAFGIFIKPLSQEFGWSRTEISLALSLCTFSVIGLAPGLGFAIDRFGVRRVLLPSIVIFGLVVSSLALLTSSLIHLYFMFILVPVVGIATIPTSYTRVILNWFDEDRGLALGLALSGVGFGAVIVPPLLQFAISHYGWRSAYLTYGFLVIFINLPVAYFFLRESPKTDERASDQQNTPAQEIEGLTLRQALRKRSFWWLIIIFFLLGLSTLAVSVHLFSALTDQGIGAGQAASYLSILGIFLILARVVCGALIDRFFAPVVAGLFLTGMALGIVLLGIGVEGYILFISIALLGLGFGAEFDLMSYLISRYLGLRSYGQIYGFVYASFSFGAGIGPVIMGLIYDTYGAYSIGFMIFAMISIVAAALAALLGPYPSLQRVKNL